MLNCREMSELASDFLEGNARWHERVAARLHLLMCRFCRRYFRQLQVTIHTIRRVRRPEVKVDAAKILAAIDRAEMR
jgi:predicted anti-sigma-YlaC factor YlaD